jgi:predicted Kef-type K+ transport protein
MENSKNILWKIWPWITFGAGLVVGLLGINLLKNLVGDEKLTFSTTEILSFVFGIALSAASTVLAIVAIQLGKASEYEMIKRSDEAIRLQQ